MSLQSLFSEVDVVSNDIIVDCKANQITEHMWACLDFSYDPTFPDDNLLIPDSGGEYSLLVSHNGINWETWLTGLDVTTSDYQRPYKLAGWVRYVKAVPTTVPTTTVAVPVPPFVAGNPIHARLSIVKV